MEKSPRGMTHRAGHIGTDTRPNRISPRSMDVSAASTVSYVAQKSPKASSPSTSSVARSSSLPSGPSRATHPATRDRVELDVADGTALGVAGTPTFYLDGEPLSVNSLEEFTAAVEAATQD